MCLSLFHRRRISRLGHTNYRFTTVENPFLQLIFLSIAHKAIFIIRSAQMMYHEKSANARFTARM